MMISFSITHILLLCTSIILPNQVQVEAFTIAPPSSTSPLLASHGLKSSLTSSSLSMKTDSKSNKNGNALVSSMVASLLAINTLTLTSLPTTAQAEGPRQVGEIAGSGLVFKDTLNVESFDDPKVQGVTLYLSNFQKPVTERLGKDFFSDPSSTALTCAKSGPIAIADNIHVGKDGEEVFEESKSLLFKTLRVKRIYDKEKNTVIYVSYNTRIDKSDDSNKSRFKSSLCAVGLD